MVRYVPHPLSALSAEETALARDVALAASPGEVIQFRMIYRQEPDKAQLIPFLELEHSGNLRSDSPRPPRVARVHYVRTNRGSERLADEIEASVDLDSRTVVSKEVVGQEFLAGLST